MPPDMDNLFVRTNKKELAQKKSSRDPDSGTDSGPAAPADTHFGIPPTEQPEAWGGGNSDNRRVF